MHSAEERACLGHQIAETLLGLRHQRERGLAVCGHVQSNRRFATKFDGAEMAPREHRRIDQCGERDRRKRELAVRSGLGEQSARMLPARGQAQARPVADLIGRHARRVEQQPVPLQHQQRVGGFAVRGGRLRAERRQQIEADVEHRDARRHLDVEGEHIHRVALPRNRRAGSRDLQTRERIDRPAGAVIARDPLRVAQRERTGCDGNAEMRRLQPTRSLACIDLQRDGRGRARTGRDQHEQQRRTPKGTQNVFHAGISVRCYSGRSGRRRPRERRYRGRSARHIIRAYIEVRDPAQARRAAVERAGGEHARRIQMREQGITE